jgi:gluconolactonase
MVLGCSSNQQPDVPQQTAIANAAPSASEDASPGASGPGAQPHQPDAVAPALALRGLAAKVCPPGQYAALPSGALTATAIAKTEPTALDAKDTPFHLYEGPVWLNGALYFSDFKTSPGFPSRILRYTPEQGLGVWLADSGTNGLALAPSGKQLAGARHKTKSISVFSEDGKSAQELATVFAGKPFNSPNDLTWRSDGNWYFTDPDFQAGANKPQPSTNVYRVSPQGEVSVVDDSIENPNGVALSPDESFLFVAGNLEAGFVKRYPVAADGSVGSGEVFAQPVAVPDGLTFDCAGNLYVTEHTGRKVRVFSSAGAELLQITGFEKNVTNVAFGGPEGKTLFVTTTGALYQAELPIPGLPH